MCSSHKPRHLLANINFIEFQSVLNKRCGLTTYTCDSSPLTQAKGSHMVFTYSFLKLFQ